MPGPNFGGYMTPRSRKYRELYLHLCGVEEREWSTSFSCIETIIGSELPPSARNYQEWWSNHQGAGIHQQARAWIAAGWRVAEVNTSTERVLFRRTN